MERADVVVVGGGTVGAWTACLLAEEGRSVVLVEADTLGSGASSRAAGMVRAQGGTEAAIRLGLFSREFYATQRDRYPLDSGFVAQGYLMPCFTDEEVAAAHDRIALQQSLGLDVQWWDGDEVDRRATGLAPGATRGASYAAGDGYIDAPRNVLAYTAALVALGVEVREHRSFTGLRVEGGRAVGVDTSDGPDRRRRRRADRGSGPGRGRRRSGWARVGGRYAAPGGRHRAGARRRPTHPADGLRRDVGHLLAAGRGGRPAVGHEQPRRAARPGPRVRPRLLPADARTRRRAVPGDRGARRTALVGGHDRLHPRPPADHRPVAPRRRSR